MMTTDEQVRAAVKAMYPNSTWAKQVDAMGQEQVLAIYLKNLKTVPELPEKQKPPEQEKLF